LTIAPSIPHDWSRIFALSNAAKNTATSSGTFLQSQRDAIAALRAGELVVFPTETFYGIGADALSPAALERIFALKGRVPDKPIALIAADAASAFDLARTIPDAARRLAEAFWPGPLTLVMPARSGLPAALLGPDGGVGVRVSSHPTALALASGLGHPITATSANLSGQAPAATLAAARDVLGPRIAVYLEGGTLAGGAPSTVVAFDSAGFRILRAGAISEDAIKTALSIKGPK
jgi:L-threonylcarbamoyladenylate synthase